MQADGKFVAGGNVLTDINNNSWDFVICRFNSDGLLDTTFNGHGIDTLDMSPYDSWNDYESFSSISLQVIK
jgi:hypothetical protein